VFKAIGGEETIQTWVDETNYRADRYFQSGRNMEEEEKERENDYELGSPLMISECLISSRLTYILEQ